MPIARVGRGAAVGGHASDDDGRCNIHGADGAGASLRPRTRPYLIHRLADSHLVLLDVQATDVASAVAALRRTKRPWSMRWGGAQAGIG
jgi:hypothetical protein